jgi:hypothetical protein
MAHPSAIKQAEKDVLNVLTLEQGGVNSPPPSAPGVMNKPLESLYRRTEKLRQAPDQWTDADSDAARLALELECLLLDTKDMAAVSKWWDSANDALELHRQRLAAPTAPAQPAIEQVGEREHDLSDVRCGCCGYMTYHREHMGCIRAATTPTAPAHRPLTDEQIEVIYNNVKGLDFYLNFARAIEAHIKGSSL